MTNQKDPEEREKVEMAKIDSFEPAHDAVVGQGVCVDSNQLLRRLNNRQIQLIAIGGSIGTGLFVTIGSGLHASGPAGLLLAFIFYCIFYPVAGGFVRLAGHFVGDAFGFMAGWNYFIYEALVIPFEIGSLAVLVQYWNEDAPIWAVCLACIVLYTVINSLVVNAYGEAEFWLSGGKVILVIALFMFTFVTMAGGNPKHDSYGFRHWNSPGAFAGYRSSGSLGHWEGFLSATWSASFCIVGPEYISLVAAEAKHPRKYLKSAYQTIYFRFFFFFIMSALAVGIVLPYNDPTLVNLLLGNGSGAGTAAASPYVIAMKNLGISVFPHIVNALLVTSIFSAGNTYVYCTSRSLYSMAIEGRAPAIFKKCTKQGIPIYSLALTMAFACLSFLQATPKTASALSLLLNLVTGGAFINYFVMSVTYVYFYRALKAQGVDRKTLPYYGRFQPYCGYIASVFFLLVIGVFGYTSLAPFNTKSFFSCYTMALLSICFYLSWKLLNRGGPNGPKDVDLVWERLQVDAYEAIAVDDETTFWGEIAQLLYIKRKSTSSV
ncbi:amino acid permease-domain-containing protein [Penicillium cosmopolitanum]|uniref:Amino acid permease-domain-containing protein n=1 Tax=Penicillium cosmopolitanum TaxID=1131564 RepID=A0A9W9W0F0_9EURO|nr:amino acid permease-domain-containing protein [Penicillium cosmopolitanum]KAJ5392505.1 amino acid permease-domain-containing protein [Penicillium cosmopolitanum]